MISLVSASSVCRRQSIYTLSYQVAPAHSAKDPSVSNLSTNEMRGVYRVKILDFVDTRTTSLNNSIRNTPKSKHQDIGR